MRYIKKVHLSASGISLAFASLGSLLSIHGTLMQALCAAASAFIFIILTIKILMFKEVFLNDVKNANTVGVFPTYLMTVMTLSAYSFMPLGLKSILKAIWLTASVLHILLALLFFKNHVLKSAIKDIMPNWFITFVAYALAGISAPAFGMAAYGRFTVALGLCCYFIILPLIFYKVAIVKNIPDNLRPTVWLINSPINICITAYLSSYKSPNPVFLLALISISIFSMGFAFCFTGFKQIIRYGFKTSASAFTFPTVIFVTAMKSSYYFYLNRSWINADLSFIFIILEAVAALTVFGVFIRYIFYVFNNAELDEPVFN